VEERSRPLSFEVSRRISLSGSLWGGVGGLSNKSRATVSPWPWRIRGSASVAVATILTTSTHPIPCHLLGHPHQARGSSLHVDCVLVAPLGDRQDTRLTFSTRRQKEAARRINPLTRKTRADPALTKITNPPIQRQKKMRGSKGVWA
jgi:hypothetical protein